VPVQQARFRPFGERLITAGSAGAERQGFIGERQDELSGLIYLNARFYDPHLFRRQALSFDLQHCWSG